MNTPAWERLPYEDRSLPTTYRRIGELYAERGEREQALEYYGKFVDLWQDADPELQPLARDVRRRMARLAGEKP